MADEDITVSVGRGSEPAVLSKDPEAGYVKGDAGFPENPF